MMIRWLVLQIPGGFRENDPIPQTDLELREENGKQFIILRVLSGVETPYYYVGDGSRTAFVRVGNESVQAGAIELKRLVLRGSR